MVVSGRVGDGRCQDQAVVVNARMGDARCRDQAVVVSGRVKRERERDAGASAHIAAASRDALKASAALSCHRAWHQWQPGLRCGLDPSCPGPIPVTPPPPSRHGDHPADTRRWSNVGSILSPILNQHWVGGS